MSLEFWFVLPVSFLFATIAMTSGVGGATFFAPFFMLVLRLLPEIAIGTGLITEVFGFASGLYAYAHKKLMYPFNKTWQHLSFQFRRFLANTGISLIYRGFLNFASLRQE